MGDSVDINKDAEQEAAAAAEALAAGNDAGKKQAQKVIPGSAMKKKPASTVPPGKSVDKQATVSYCTLSSTVSLSIAVREAVFTEERNRSYLIAEQTCG